jgi:hypothetical protein
VLDRVTEIRRAGHAAQLIPGGADCRLPPIRTDSTIAAMASRRHSALLAAACLAASCGGVLGIGTPAQADDVSVVAIPFGNPHDVPITGDWDGSGKTQIGVYRPSNDTFYLGDAGGVAAQSLPYGNPNDVPITGDWNGSGKTQIGVYRPSDRTFYLGDINGVAATSITFGNPGDVPITGDWNGSGKTQIGVYRPSNDTFYLREVAPPPPPPAVATVPVTVPVPTPPPGTRRHPRVRVKITISWTYNRDRTRIHRIQMSRLPRGARVTVTGRVSERARLTIRNGRLPRAALL